MHYPFANMSIAERYAYLKRLEKEVKEETKKLQDELKSLVAKEESIQTDFGSIKTVKKTTTKPAETLKVFLLENDLLDICKKDEIDMQKVNDLVEAGIIDEEALQEHLIVTESEYLKVGK